MDGIENPSAELAALKAGFDELREQNADLRGEVQALKQNQPAQQPATPAVGRRGLLAGGGVGALALLASMGGASAATDPTDGDGDLGTSANPWDTYLDGLALVTEQVSTNTTVTKPVVLYDSALSSLTLTIDSSLEGPSGYSQPVVFIDRTGNADTNPVTVNDSGGSAVATIPAANSFFETWWDSGEWVTKRFIPSVDAGTVTADELAVTKVAGVAELTSNQSISNTTNTRIAFDQKPIEDTDIISINTSTGELTVQKAGRFVLSGMITWGPTPNWTDGDQADARIEAPSGTREVSNTTRKQGTVLESRPLPAKMVDLSVNDVIEATVRQDSGSSIAVEGGSEQTFLTAYYLGS